MKKLLSLFCLTVLLLAMFLPLAAQEDSPDFLPPIEEPDIETAAMPAASNHVFLPLLVADGQPRNFVPDSVVAASGGFDRNLIETGVQAWWMPAYGHVHTDIKLPYAGVVSGVLPVWIRIVMHDNPGKLHLFAIAYEETTHLVDVKMGDQTCAASVCAWGFSVNLDTRKMQDGCRELRIKSYINTPDGKQMITSSGIPVMVRNGGSSSDFNKSCTTGQMIGRSWYTNINYVNSIFEHVPTAPVSGVITVGFRAQGEASSHLTVELDKSHFIPAVDGWPEVQASTGVTLFDKDGNFTKFQHVAIDTRTLSNGWHNLAVRSTSLATAKTNGVDNHSLGVARYRFFVNN